MFWVGDAGVDQAREAVLVAVCAECQLAVFLDDRCRCLSKATVRRFN